LCRQVRKTSEVPVIILTARDDEIDRVLGLELGADDYVTKPFSPRELVARVKAILRRTGALAKTEALTTEIGAVVVDTGRREVTCAGDVVPLTTREFDLLAYLAAHRGLALSRRADRRRPRAPAAEEARRRAAPHHRVGCGLPPRLRRGRPHPCAGASPSPSSPSSPERSC
jgi:hypothetical protein